MFRRSLPLLLASFEDEEILTTLKQIDRMVGEGRLHEALKAIRTLYRLEERAMEIDTPPVQVHRLAADEPKAPLPLVPPEIRAGRRKAQLLDDVLPDVGHEQIAVAGVPAEPLWVANP